MPALVIKPEGKVREDEKPKSATSGLTEEIIETASKPDEGVEPKKRRGRPPGSKNATGGRKKGTKRSKQKLEDCLILADKGNSVFCDVFEAIGGEDAAATPEEKETLNYALAIWLQEKGLENLSPAQMLAVAYGMFAVSKLKKPTVRERFGMAATFAGKKFVSGVKRIFAKTSGLFGKLKSKLGKKGGA